MSAVSHEPNPERLSIFPSSSYTIGIFFLIGALCWGFKTLGLFKPMLKGNQGKKKDQNELPVKRNPATVKGKLPFGGMEGEEMTSNLTGSDGSPKENSSFYGPSGSSTKQKGEPLYVQEPTSTLSSQTLPPLLSQLPPPSKTSDKSTMSNEIEITMVVQNEKTTPQITEEAEQEKKNKKLESQIDKEMEQENKKDHDEIESEHKRSHECSEKDAEKERKITTLLCRKLGELRQMLVKDPRKIPKYSTSQSKIESPSDPMIKLLQELKSLMEGELEMSFKEGSIKKNLFSSVDRDVVLSDQFISIDKYLAIQEYEVDVFKTLNLPISLFMSNFLGPMKTKIAQPSNYEEDDEGYITLEMVLKIRNELLCLFSENISNNISWGILLERFLPSPDRIQFFKPKIPFELYKSLVLTRAWCLRFFLLKENLLFVTE